MFGYITPLKDELKVRDFETFKHYYCGLCMAIKNNFGNIPRIGLSYDTTFFAVLLDGLSIEDSTTFLTPCIKHPLNKRECIKNNNALSYATDLNMALIYYKVLDDTLDDKHIKSIALSKILSPYKKKITNRKLENSIKDNLDYLHVLEDNKNFTSIDEISDPFSKIIAEILRDCPFELNEDSKLLRDNLYRFGYAFGKWIYLMDALDDLKKDFTNDSFNPIYEVYYKDNLSIDEFIMQIKEPIDTTILYNGAICSEILQDLPLKRNKDLLKNIINLGLIFKYNNVVKNL